MKRFLSYLVVGIAVITGFVNYFTASGTSENATNAAPAATTADVETGQDLRATRTDYFSRTETPLITDEQLTDKDLHYIVHMLPSDPSVRNYAMLYDTRLRMAYWVAYPLCNYYMKGSGKRTDNWDYDPSIGKEQQAHLERGIDGYDRGHQLPSADRMTTKADNATTFYYTNITPQTGKGLNQSIWNNLEEKVRRWASHTDTLYVVTGAMPTDEEHRTVTYALDNDGRRIAVPRYYYKALARKVKGRFQTIAFWLEQKAYDDPNSYMDYALSVSDLERLTGFTFFPTLDVSVKERLDLSQWR